MIRRKDFSRRSISSLNFFLTFNSNLLYSSSLAGVSCSSVSTSVSSSCTIRFMSTTIIRVEFDLLLTFWRTVHDIVFLLSMLENAFRAKCFRVIFAKKLDLFTRVSGTVCDCAFYGRVAVVICRNLLHSLSEHRQTCEDLVVDRKVFWCNLVSRFVIWAGNRLVLLHLFAALETETVTAWQRERLLVLVIVGLEADTTFKY